MAENEVAKTFSEIVTDKLISVEEALPADFNKVRFVQNALSVINGNKELQKCNKASIVSGLVKGAYLGLDFANGECYLIPYGGEAQFQTDYKGEVKFVKKYSIREIKDIYAEVIREKDTFERTIVDGEQSFNFKQVLNGGEIIGAFAVCLYKDGGVQMEVMTVEDINSVRNNYSKAAQSKAWKNSFPEMAKKVVLRRLCKHINTDFESVEARQAWDEGSGMEFTNARADMNTNDVVNPFAKKEEPEPVIVADVVPEVVTEEVIAETAEVFK